MAADVRQPAGVRRAHQCSYLRGVGLALATATGVVVAQTDPPPTAQPRRPNIVLIVAEGLGVGDLGSYGQVLIHTPRLDELASRAVRFTDFHAGGATELDARATLMTGRLLTNGLIAGAPTLGEWMARAGYHTGFIGHWGLGTFNSEHAPHRHGFVEVVAYDSRPHALDLFTDALYRHDPQTGFEGRVPLLQNSAGQRELYLPNLLTRAAAQFCKNNKPELPHRARPFFLVVSYPVPQAVFERGLKLPETHLYADRPWPEPQKAKALAISWLDQHVGEIMGQLESSGIARDTIVLFSSLNGPPLGASPDPGFFRSTASFTPGQDTLNQGNIRVPLLVRWPFWMDAPRSSDVLSGAQDIAATLLEMARVSAPPELQGVSLLPTLVGQPQTNRHPFLHWPVTAASPQQALRFGQWKLVHRGGDHPIELYDLSHNPAETRNLAELAPSLMRRLWRWPQDHDANTAEAEERPSASAR